MCISVLDENQLLTKSPVLADLLPSRNQTEKRNKRTTKETNGTNKQTNQATNQQTSKQANKQAILCVVFKGTLFGSVLEGDRSPAVGVQCSHRPAEGSIRALGCIGRTCFPENMTPIDEKLEIRPRDRRWFSGFLFGQSFHKKKKKKKKKHQPDKESAPVECLTSPGA